MKVFFTLLFVWLLGSTALWGQPADVVWNSQSRNSSGLHALRRRRHWYECVGRG